MALLPSAHSKTPMPTAAQHQFCAEREASRAPSMSPAAMREFTLAENTIATMPRGGKHRSVVRIAIPR